MFRLTKARLRKNPMTYLLIGVNVLVYILLCSKKGTDFLTVFFQGPSYDSLLLYGAKENSLIALGQWYRLFTPIFLHANFVHLTVNIIGLWSVGALLENSVGSKYLFFLFIIAGVTGNFCSFAMLPNLSVGASGGLFGILLCLYVIQKYQEKVSKQYKNQKPINSFGNIILINGILNILFGITFPIFDWACHLGGSIAGVLVGFAIVTQHSWKLRLLTHISTNMNVLAQVKLPQKRFYEHHAIYYIGIVLINISFSLAVFKVEKYQKIGGLGALLASQNKTASLKYTDLSLYSDLLIFRNKETNPNSLLYGAYYLFQKQEFFAAYKLFYLLNELAKNNYVSPTIEKQKYDFLLEKGLTLSKKDASLEQKTYDKELPVVNYSRDEDYCAKPANLFMTLGFFDIAGSLYECAYILNDKNDSYALKAFEAFHKIQNEQGMAEVLTLVKSNSN